MEIHKQIILDHIKRTIILANDLGYKITLSKVHKDDKDETIWFDVEDMCIESLTDHSMF